VKDTNNADIVTYTYDSQSRRVARTEGSNTTLYLYDAWNCLAEYTLHNSSFNLHTSFTWGLDLSGSLQGAGGVGGLLAVTRHAAQSTTHFFPTYDGNGNVSEYLDATGSIAAHYEYDPFGRTIVANGSQAADFSYRFSTKPVDPATGLYYYGYRWFDPETGRWINRDPIEESGGVNLYGFVGNQAVTHVDRLGMWKIERSMFSRWAKAIAKKGDTLQSLAREIDLDPLEVEKWAKRNDVTTPFDYNVTNLNVEWPEGCTVDVPNVVSFYISEDYRRGAGLDAVFFNFPNAINATFLGVRRARLETFAWIRKYESRGFYLWGSYEADDADYFKSLWKEDGIYGILFAGHGAREEGKNLGFRAAHFPTLDDVDPSEVKPPYHLGVVGAFTCYSADAQSMRELPRVIREGFWSEHVAPGGVFAGWSGRVLRVTGPPLIRIPVPVVIDK
jgi:RHS repeat-associated protein